MHVHNRITSAVAVMALIALIGVQKHGIAVGLMSGGNGLSKTLYCRGAFKANWFKRQLHLRQVVAVGWETQNSSHSHGMRMEMGSGKETGLFERSNKNSETQI